MFASFEAVLCLFEAQSNCCCFVPICGCFVVGKITTELVGVSMASREEAES